MISRRRILTISAAAACSLPMSVSAGLSARLSAGSTSGSLWQGRALGAEVSIDLRGEPKQAAAALEAARDTLRRLERYFSIYDPNSLISRLNRHGALKMPPEFARLMDSVDQIHGATDGAFDPTIQPLFAAMLGSGGTVQPDEFARLNGLIGWTNVNRQGAQIAFAKKGMAITLNGIAQGYATDRVSEVLAAHGFVDPVVNMGEYRVGNRPAQLLVRNSIGTQLASVNLHNGAMATSSSNGFTFRNGAGHILSPTGEPHSTWNTVSVVADTATVADGFSTALLLIKGTDLAKNLIDSGALRSVILEDQHNRVHSL